MGLAKASESKARKAQDLASVDERIVQTELQLTSRQSILAELKMKLAKERRGGSKRTEDVELMHKQTLLKLETELESWRLMYLKNQKIEEKTRNELEAQIKLMESRMAMVQARDYQINTLNKAIDLSDTAALNQPPMKKHVGKFYGIHVTSVVDHRMDEHAKPLYYKHQTTLADYHEHVYRVENDPQFKLETEIERARRIKQAAEMRKRKVEDRRPSLT